jgi:hypothetical protein
LRSGCGDHALRGPALTCNNATRKTHCNIRHTTYEPRQPTDGLACATAKPRRAQPVSPGPDTMMCVSPCRCEVSSIMQARHARMHQSTTQPCNMLRHYATYNATAQCNVPGATYNVQHTPWAMQVTRPGALCRKDTAMSQPGAHGAKREWAKGVSGSEGKS